MLQLRPPQMPTGFRSVAWIATAFLLASCGDARADAFRTGTPQDAITSGAVTSSGPQSGRSVTSDQMRAAKPMPLPGREGPPVVEPGRAMPSHPGPAGDASPRFNGSARP